MNSLYYKCIAVGCVARALVTTSPACMPPYHACPFTTHAPLHHAWPLCHTCPPVNRITDRCKNITFPQLRFADSNNLTIYCLQVSKQLNVWWLLESHFSGCFWKQILNQILGRWRNLWMIFCQSMSTVWVIGGGDIRTLTAINEFVWSLCT